MTISLGLSILICIIVFNFRSYAEESHLRTDSDEAHGVCFVVRTYWGHGDAHGGELRAFMQSLQAQDNPKYDASPWTTDCFSCYTCILSCSWEAILVMVDKKPFPEAYDIIQSLNESRAWVFAEWVR